MNKETLYKNRHSLIRYGIPALLFCLLYFLMISPTFNRVSGLEFQIADMTARSDKFKVVLKQEKLMRADILRARAELARFQEKLHTSDAGEKVIREVLACAKEKKVSIIGMEAGPVAKGEFFNSLTLKITMEGGFAAQGRLIETLESAKPAYLLSELSMHGSEGGILKTQFTLKALVRNESK